MPCPLCLIGLIEPHTKEDWATIGKNGVNREKLNAVLEERRKARELYEDEHPEVRGQFICG